MVSLKKTAFAVMALVGVSGVASAGMYAPPPAPGCTEGSVSVPCEKRGWSVEAQALYVQLSSLKQATATANVGTINPGEPTSGTLSFSDLQPDWAWGFLIGGNYYFGTGSDIGLNWTHLSKDSSATAVGTDVFGLFIQDELIGGSGEPLNSDVDNVATDVDNKYDAVNFEFGQHVNYGEHVDARFHAGLQYARLKQDITQTGWNSGLGTAVTDSTSIESKFDGIGPRAGVDTSYDFGNGVSLVGDTAFGLLIGDQKFTRTETFADGAGNASSIVGTAKTDNAIVPEAEAKLGVRYTHPLAQGDLSAEAGYQVVNYWDALTSTDTDTSLVTDNFGYNGVYFGLKWLGNV